MQMLIKSVRLIAAWPGTFLFKKQKMSPDSYSLRGVLQVVPYTSPATISILLPDMPEGPQTPPDTSMSCLKLLWLPHLVLPVTPRALFSQRNPSW